MKVASIVGARPQFVKAAPVSKALLQAGHTEVLIHTGQHYDYHMSEVFFVDLGIAPPTHNLGVGSGSHGWQTGEMLMRIEKVLLAAKPDVTVVYGDTNSTIAGALAAVKMGIPLAHVEAGLRSFNRSMPEEHNRILTDHCADLLLCPTENAIINLTKEGITRGVQWVGDTMYDAVLQFGEVARKQSRILDQLALHPKRYFLATIHRASNTDNTELLKDLLKTFSRMDDRVVFPVHPRTRSRLGNHTHDLPNIHMIDPVGYFDMLMLEANARAILTDSGGVQKEAFFFSVPCITIRNETEWIETVASGWNMVTGTDPERILAAARKQNWPTSQPPLLFGHGDAALRVTKALEEIGT